MRAEVLVTLAKEAGIRVEDLDFLRGHPRGVGTVQTGYQSESSSEPDWFCYFRAGRTR